MAEKIAVDAALALIGAHVAPLASDRIRIDADAVGYFLAEDVAAAADNPRFDCSAMDGYALGSRDTRAARPSKPVLLGLAAPIPAEGPAGILRRGLAAPVSTGSAVPEGADAILPREEGRLDGGALLITETIAAGRNVRTRGEDGEKGALLLSAGQRLSPEAIGALLAFGVASADVRRRPQLVLIPTGSELAPAETAGDAARLDVNGPMIGGLCRSLGLTCDVYDAVSDNVASIETALTHASASPADMIITSGGVSAGDHDLVRRILDARGAQVIFHGIAMRPGKPLLFALLPCGRPFFGLPGNPVAALVGFRFFVLAAIRRLMGLPPERSAAVPPPTSARRGTTLFLRASRDANGVPLLASEQRSHMLRSLLDTDCWIRLDASEAGGDASLFAMPPTLT
ncbi:molybdopterin molybdotransferase MoeA [Sphingopyxis sp.]|uniref:molybdopterin molybdotransferase MoeA n=1 Tax=Sphingopyxis sp. TaxID=1908224 RepID=UPI003BA9E67F